MPPGTGANLLVLQLRTRPARRTRPHDPAQRPSSFADAGACGYLDSGRCSRPCEIPSGTAFGLRRANRSGLSVAIQTSIRKVLPGSLTSYDWYASMVAYYIAERK